MLRVVENWRLSLRNGLIATNSRILLVLHHIVLLPRVLIVDHALTVDNFDTGAHSTVNAAAIGKHATVLEVHAESVTVASLATQFQLRRLHKDIVEGDDVGSCASTVEIRI